MRLVFIISVLTFSFADRAKNETISNKTSIKTSNGTSTIANDFASTTKIFSNTQKTGGSTIIKNSTPNLTTQKSSKATSNAPIKTSKEAMTTKWPIVAPTEKPTVAPTEEPTVEPTEESTVAPTEEPTVVPTEETSEAPTFRTESTGEVSTNAPTTTVAITTPKPIKPRELLLRCLALSVHKDYLRHAIWNAQNKKEAGSTTLAKNYLAENLKSFFAKFPKTGCKDVWRILRHMRLDLAEAIHALYEFSELLSPSHREHLLRDKSENTQNKQSSVSQPKNEQMVSNNQAAE